MNVHSMSNPLLPPVLWNPRTPTSSAVDAYRAAPDVPPMALRCVDQQLLHAYPKKARYLVGVSGGCDSVALLHWLLEAGYRNLVVCHLNHQLRGAASRADARFVEQLAARHRVEF